MRFQDNVIKEYLKNVYFVTGTLEISDYPASQHPKGNAKKGAKKCKESPLHHRSKI